MTNPVINGSIQITDPNPKAWYQVTFSVSVQTDALFQLYSSPDNISFIAVNRTILDIHNNGDQNALTVIINVTTNPFYLQVRNIFDMDVNLDSFNSNKAFSGTVTPITAFVTIDKLR
jgi:hypothetical protein